MKTPCQPGTALLRLRGGCLAAPGASENLAGDALELLTTHARLDPTYVPIKDDHSRRWQVCSAGGEFETLTTVTKWYDMRARLGGGRAIGLTMHVLGLSFVLDVEALNVVRGACAGSVWIGQL